jgi:putative nucleotidyltransferase with HDIG domain
VTRPDGSNMTFALFARPKNTTDTPAPRPKTDQAVFGKLSKLETLPHLSDTATRAMALCNNPDSTLAEMSDLIRRDGVLVAGVLKLANSVVYRGSTAVTDLNQAVVRLGMKGCRNVVAAAGMKNMYAKMSPAVRVGCENVLRHSLFVGGLASAVTRTLRLSLGGEEYTAGLLHDIGRLVMWVNSPERVAAVPSGCDSDPAVRAAEKAAFGADHCALGVLFAFKNNLPKPISRAIEHHHDPEVESEFRTLTAVIAFSDAIANHLTTNRNLEHFSLDTEAGFEMLRRLVVSERMLEFPDQLKGLVVGCVRETRTILKSMGE